jgi:hypothetical protein
MATSGTYTFGSTATAEFITDAYERCGIFPDLLTAQQINSAQRSLNLLLSEWINKGLNLWTVKQGMLALEANKAAYDLPSTTSDVREATIRTSERPLGGTAYSSAGGTAANAFDGDTDTACTQTAPNGYISYDYGDGNDYLIAMVGVQSNATLTYTLVFEYSADDAAWDNAYSAAAQSYPIGETVWAVIPVPTGARYFRVRETGGATLNVQELYFNTTLNDLPITRLSRAEYISIPNKNQTGRPSSFYVDRQISPILYIWPVPTAQYNNLFYTRVETIQDIGQLTNMADIPQRFYEALCAGLASKLALKYTPERADLLTALYDKAFDLAAREDTEKVPLRIYGDFSSGWGSV